MIRRGPVNGKYPNAGDFCRELEVSWATVMRDIEYLRTEENAPIEYVPDGFGYRLSDATWNLRPLQVSRTEVFAFSIARKLLDRFKGTPLEMDMRSVLRKIGDSLEGNMTLDAGGLTDHFTVLGDDYVEQDPEVWKAVAGCVERREKMAATYRKFNGQEGKYELEPFHLLSYHGNWYVLARDAGKDRMGTYAVSRIKAVTGMRVHFDLPEGFVVEEHIRKAFGVVGGEEEMDVRLLFSKNVAAYISERKWHPTQRLIKRRGGAVELRMKTAGWKELVRFVLSWQPDVKVLAPRTLRERVQSKMREGLDR